MAFPTTAVLDDFNRTESPLAGNWGTHVQSGQSDFAANGTQAAPLSGYGSQIWTTQFAAPLEAHLRQPATPADLYLCWAIQPGTENGSGTLSCYYLHSQAGTTDVQIDRFIAGSGSNLLTISSTTNVAGDQWGVSHAANGDIVAYLNGTQAGTVNDSTWLTTGYLGVISSINGFDDFGGGSIVATQAIRPDADIVTTGWATAPLWSKIEEEAADATVITATAS